MNNFSGDIAFRVLESVKNVSSRALQNDVSDDLEDKTQIYVCDINPNMLSVGKKRAIERGIGFESWNFVTTIAHHVHVHSKDWVQLLIHVGLGGDHTLLWVEGDAEALSFGDCSMDGYTIAFGIRNVTHIERALTEAYR